MFDDKHKSLAAKILRVGTPSQDASSSVHAITLAKRLESQASPLRAEFLELQEVLQVLDEEITTLQAFAREQYDREEQQKYISALRRDLTRRDRSIDAIQHKIQKLTEHQTQLQKQLQTPPSLKDRVFPWRRPRRKAELDATHQSIQALHAEGGTLLQTFSQLEDQLAKAQRQEDERVTASEYGGRRRSTCEIQEALHRAEAQLDHTHSRLEELRVTLQNLERDVVKEAQLIATTLTRASCFRVLESERFEMIIVDEASLASLPALFAALCLTTKYVVIVGDFCNCHRLSRRPRLHLHRGSRNPFTMSLTFITTMILAWRPSRRNIACIRISVTWRAPYIDSADYPSAPRRPCQMIDIPSSRSHHSRILPSPSSIPRSPVRRLSVMNATPR